jgi:hypothetical protein
MRPDGLRSGAWRAWLAAGLGAAVAGGAHAQPVEPGHQRTLRHGLGAPTAVDLGGPERDGRVERTFAGATHHVAERLALPGRHASAPVGWPGGIAVATSGGLWVWREGSAPRVVDVGAIDARPVVLPSGELLVAARDGRLLVLDADARIVREGRASGSVRTSPLVLEDGSVIVSALDRSVARFDASLARVFAVTLPAGVVHAPARLSAERIVVAASERLHVLDLSGSVLRTVDLGDRAVAAPVVDRAGDVHVLLALGTVVVLSQGAFVRARVELGARVFDQTAMLGLAADGSYRVALPAIGLAAFGASGEPLWTASTDAPFFGPLAIDGAGATLAFDRRGRLIVIDGAGTITERLELGGLAQGFPLLAADGSLWVTTDAPEVVHVVEGALR